MASHFCSLLHWFSVTSGDVAFAILYPITAKVSCILRAGFFTGMSVSLQVIYLLRENMRHSVFFRAAAEAQADRSANVAKGHELFHFVQLQCYNVVSKNNILWDRMSTEQERKEH